MPNWKKVIVSGSNAEINNLNAESYTILPTGSGSVPARSYPIPFIDTSGGGDDSPMFKDNQDKLRWFPAGSLNITGNLQLGDLGASRSYFSGSDAILSRTITGSQLQIATIGAGSTENRIVVVNNDGSTFYRTDLSLTGAKGDNGEIGAQGINGTNGQKGSIGPTGVQGSIGAKGVQGDIGPQGTSGTNGAKGATGTQGTDGAKGENGAQGTIG